jgi:hypothetical protein
MSGANVRVYNGGAITDVTPIANWAYAPECLAQAMSIGGIAFQGTSGVYVSLSGTTAMRPTLAQLQANDFNKGVTGLKFYDTTLGKIIIFDGVGGWHDPITGALV